MAQWIICDVMLMISIENNIKTNNKPKMNRDENPVLSTDVVERLKLEQKLPVAIVGGVIAGIIGAALWAYITMLTEYQIGYMAIAIGAGVGYAIRVLGKGVSQIFGMLGGLIAVLSCVLGNYLTIIACVASAEELNFFFTLMNMKLEHFLPIMEESFSGIDLLFYAIAGYEGYKLSFRKVTSVDVAALRS